MNLKELKEIFRLIEKTDFNEVEIIRGDWSVRVERGKQQAAPALMQQVVPAIQAQAPVAATENKAESKGKKSTPKGSSENSGELITSPFVGTFYRSPSPEAAPYVEVGQSIQSGQVLCIIEAMKLMNEIESEVSGKIVEIFPENGQPVEFGEKLFRIEAS